MDIAPQPLFFDPSVGPVVVYRYLDGPMWDRRVPAAAALAGLADLMGRAARPANRGFVDRARSSAQLAHSYSALTRTD